MDTPSRLWRNPRKPKVTAIVSTYCAERFIRGCMEDLIDQTIFDETEVIVIDSGSPQRESSIVAEYAATWPQIKLIRTDREPLYAAWNRAIQVAQGEYLTSANTDDRHRHDAFEILAKSLDCAPEVGLVYADQWISYSDNEDFASCQARDADKRHWPEFTPVDLLLRCITGSQPMWRKTLHEHLGPFDTKYKIAADFDMWLRIASSQELRHISQTLGVFFQDANTISGTANKLRMHLEVLDIQKRYVRQAPWSREKDVRSKLAREIFGMGYQHVRSGNTASSVSPFFREAIRLDPFNLKYLKTYIVRCIANVALK